MPIAGRARTSTAAGADVVTPKSGQRLVGEIQKLEKDVLTISTGYSDADFAIKWDGLPPSRARA